VNAIAPGYIATEMTRRVQIVFWDRSRLGGGVDLKISWDPSCSCPCPVPGECGKWICVKGGPGRGWKMDGEVDEVLS